MMDGGGAATSPALLELIEPNRWQRLQDHFARVLGIPIRTISPSHRLLVQPSWPATLLPERVIELLHVGEELEALVPPQEAPRESTTFTTPAGVTYAAVPIWATCEVVAAYFVVGPLIVGSREGELEFRQRLGGLEMDANILWPLILSLKLYTFVAIRSVLHLIEEVGTALAQFAYQARQLATILPPTGLADQAVVDYHTDRVLRSLLEAAILATRAEGGSVMAYNGEGQVLTIKVAKGLDDGIVASTRLPLNEGLSGLAITQRRILLVDDRTEDPLLRERMRRPALASSLVAPLVRETTQEPLGVLNLRTANSQHRFATEQIELLHRLLDLAGSVLTCLRVCFSQPPPST